MRSAGQVAGILSLTLMLLGTASAGEHPIVEIGATADDLSLNQFSPSAITIVAGDSVQWVANSTDMPHTVSATEVNGSRAFDSSPEITPAFISFFTGPGGALAGSSNGSAATVYVHTFESPGAFTILCKLHTGMIQRVVVENASRPQRTFNATMGRIQDGWSVERFEPSELVISSGDTVVWSNLDPSEMHTVTGYENDSARSPSSDPAMAPSFDSSPALTADALAAAGEVERARGGFLHPGASFSVTFATPGVFAYDCKLHAGMHGVVIVSSAANRAFVPGPTAGLVILALVGAHVLRNVRREK